ncbi:MAG TPA: hypothetical protein VGE12_04215 [Noviherbaspirillum sp.]
MVKLFMFLLLACVLPAWATDAMIEAELDPPEVRVNAQTTYRLRVYHAVDVADLQITGPSARLADFRAIDAGQVTVTERDGRRYRVHERRYAVFPFASGTIELAGAQATGRILSANARTPDRRVALRLDAPVQKLTVLPVGIAAAGVPWLPARSLALTEQWSAIDGGHRRTLRIEAVGIDAAQLPAVSMPIEGMAVRAETPRLDNRFDGELNVAMREQSFILTPSRAGRITVPQLQLPWWQTELDSPALATLPSRTLDGAPAAAPAAPAPRALPAVLYAIAVASLILLVAATMTWRRRNILYAAWALRRAYLSGDVHAVRDGLLRWAAQVWPDAPPLTLSALAGRLKDPGARRALAAVERALYGAPATVYDADTLKAIVLAVKRDGR